MIAVDAMGGDHAPRVVIHGAVRAALKGIPILLCGDEKKIYPILESEFPQWQTLPITVEHCTQEIVMGDEPARAVIQKKDSSLIKAINAVANGRAQAFVSAGNSGAVLVASTLLIGRVPGVLRPAVGSFLPTIKGSVFCLDLGANVDSKPSFLEQFAYMGHTYVKLMKNIDSPRVALLSNGHEAEKGCSLVKQTYKQLNASELNFVGNIEARDIFDDTVDVVVCDGFNGNILLKSIQGTAQLLFKWLEQGAQASWIRTMLLWLNKGLLRSIKKKTDYSVIGGALLLGVKHPVILAHGRSGAQAIENAILFAHQVLSKKIVSTFNVHLQQIIEKNRKFSGVVTEKMRSLLWSKGL